MEKNTCRICGLEAEHACFEAPEMMYGSGELFQYFQCLECECLQIKSVPLDLYKYYSGNYYSYRAPNFGFVEKTARWFRDKYCLTSKSIVGKFVEKKRPNEKLRVLRLAGIKPETSVLDVGAGSGYLLGTLWDHGFKNVNGIDPFIDSEIEFRPKAFVEKKDLQSLTGTWDFILLNHSLEHMSSQLDVMQKVFSSLVDGGRCIVRIPVCSSFAWKEFGVYWGALDAPRHLFLHSHKSFQILVEKAGFRIIGELQDSEVFQFWSSIQAIKGIPQRADNSYGINPSSSMFTRLEMQEFSKKAKTLNSQGQGDQTCFILEKCL